MHAFLFTTLFGACSIAVQAGAPSGTSISQGATEVPASSTSDAVTAWIKAHALDLTQSRERSTRFSPARALFDKARVVVLEERVPGTHELSDLRGEMLAFLASDCGFDVLLLDASAPACMAIDAWVLGESGDAVELVERLGSKRYETGEVRAALEWMRKANQDPSRTHKLRVAGLDAVDTRASVSALQAFMAKIDPDQAERMSAMLGPLRQVDGQGRLRYLSASSDLRRVISVMLEEQLTIMLDQRDSYIERTSVAEWEAVLEHLTLLAEAQEVLLSESATGANERRARSMLETLERQCARLGPDARAVVWTGGEPLLLDGRRATLAEHVKQKLADEARVVTFVFDEGSVRVLTPEAMDEADRLAKALAVAAAPAGTIEHTLSATGRSLALFDLRKPPSGPAEDWMRSTVRLRELSPPAEESRTQFGEVVPRLGFDAVVFVKRATPAE